MSKAAKQSILILVVLLLLTLGFTYVTISQKQKLEKENTSLQKDLRQAQQGAKDAKVEVNRLNGLIGQKEEEKRKIESQIAELREKMQSYKTQLDDISSERDTWKNRSDMVKRERDELMVKLQQKPKTVEVIKYVEKEPEKEERKFPEMSAPARSMTTTNADGGTHDDQYWASVLKEKASLELEIEKLEEELSEHSVEIVELRQAKESIGIELDALKHDKQMLEEELVNKENLVDNLSLELARTKNDKKFMESKVAQANKENGELRQKLKQLSSTKSAIEKSLVRVTQDKNEAEKKLGQTESLVQSKIDEIWEIKDSLDRSFKESKGGPASTGEVELPPIVVSSERGAVNFNAGMTPVGFNAKVVSINKENNFVIVDAGEKKGVRLGDMLSVYHGDKYVARLEVIQVRQDISAADLKDQWAEVQVGDVVR